MKLARSCRFDTGLARWASNGSVRDEGNDEEDEEEREDEDDDDNDDDDDAGPRARSWPHRRALCRLSCAYLIQGQLYYSLRATLPRKINRCAIERPRRDGARGCYFVRAVA